VGGHVTFVRDLVTFVGCSSRSSASMRTCRIFRSLSSWDASRKIIPSTSALTALNRPSGPSSLESGCGEESRLFGPWVQAGVPGDARYSGNRVYFDAAGLVAAVGVGDARQDQGELFPVQG